MAFKLVHFADLHLDTQFAGLLPEQAAGRRRRRALRDTLTRIVELVTRAGARALLCAGDLYEHERFSPDTVAFLRASFERLYPVPVVIAPGNHDWYGPASVYAQVEWSPNVSVFRESRPTPLVLDDGLTLWGAAHCAPANTSGFLDGFRVDRGGVNIGLFHAAERSWLQAQEEGKSPHAPFTQEQVAASGLDYAFLGHFHRPRDDAEHHYSYPGNPCPLSFGEDGDRAALVAAVQGDGTVTIERHQVAATEVHDVSVDVGGCASVDDVRRRVAAATRALTGSARIALTGALERAVDLRPRELIDAVSSLDAAAFRLNGLSVAYDWDAISREETVRGQFVRDVRAARLAPDDERRILVTGIRALEGRDDLEVV